MKQPPHSQADRAADSPPSGPPPMWRRPPGVAAGTWQYTHQRSIADHYDAFVEGTPLCRVDAEILSEVLPGTEVLPNPLVLDLGCGTGRAALPLAARGYDVIGIDLSQSMLRVLGQKASAQVTPGTVIPLRANLAELDCIVDRSADHAICLFATLGMIQGRKHRRDVLRHVGRIVRPGGTFVVHVHNRWAGLVERGGYRYLARSWYRGMTRPGEEFGDATYGYRGLQDMFMHRFSRRELVHDLRQNGWRIDRLLRLSVDGSTILKSRGIAGGFIAIATNTSSA